MMKQSGNNYYSFFLAFLPVIMMYKMPFVELSLATIIVIIMAIPALIYLLRHRFELKKVALIVPLLLYLLYSVTKGTAKEGIINFLILIHIVAITQGIVNVERIKKYFIFFAVCASILVIIQQILHLATGYHLPLIIYPAILDGLKEAYHSAIVAGVSRYGGMYRPAAFFLEPAHFSQYCYIGLLCALLDTPNSLRKGIVVSLGILATGSGLGLLITPLCWGIWIFEKKLKGNIKHKFSTIVVILLVVPIIGYVLYSIPFVESAVSRLTATDGDYNAIDGRLFFWDRYFGNESASSLLYGYGVEELPEEEFFTGMMTLLYAYGVIGMALFYLSLIVMIIKFHSIGRYVLLFYLGLTFSSDIIGFIWIIVIVGFAISLQSQPIMQRQSHRKVKSNSNIIKSSLIVLQNE